MRLKRSTCINKECGEFIGTKRRRNRQAGTIEVVEPRRARFFCDSCWSCASRTFKWTATGTTILLGALYAFAKWMMWF